MPAPSRPSSDRPNAFCDRDSRPRSWFSRPAVGAISSAAAGLGSTRSGGGATGDDRRCWRLAAIGGPGSATGTGLVDRPRRRPSDVVDGGRRLGDRVSAHDPGPVTARPTTSLGATGSSPCRRGRVAGRRRRRCSGTASHAEPRRRHRPRAGRRPRCAPRRRGLARRCRSAAAGNGLVTGGGGAGRRRGAVAGPRRRRTRSNRRPCSRPWAGGPSVTGFGGGVASFSEMRRRRASTGPMPSAMASTTTTAMTIQIQVGTGQS